MNLGETDLKERLVFLVQFEVSCLGDWIEFGTRNKIGLRGWGVDCGGWVFDIGLVARHRVGS